MTIQKKKNERIYQKKRTSKKDYSDTNLLTNPKSRINVDPRVFEPPTAPILTQQIDIVKKELPHIYGWKWYKWAREFYQSTNRVNLLVAANQISKSSTAIRKNIEWACNKKLWPTLFPRREPRLFYYFYPTIDTATVEFQSKWVPEFLPKGGMRDHPEYGWRVEYAGSDVSAIHFNSGVILYFKTYSQKISNLQTATLDMVTCDEEMPENYVDEILARLTATEGYFNMVFTATLGQQLWFRAMECIGTQEETFKHAYKRTVSMYDCQVYDDGSEGAWPLERIKKREEMCTTDAEKARRIHGRFVREEGRRYPAFALDKNLSPVIPYESGWRFYAGVDIGSGGVQRSAGAILILAVNAAYTLGRVCRTWRGDMEETTAGDILNKYLQLKQGLMIEQAAYDHGSREFAMISSRLGVPFLPAEKNHESGIETTNALLKQRALLIDSEQFDNSKLLVELETVPMKKTTNRKYRDDLSDALRYAVKLVPWDFAAIGFTPQEAVTQNSFDVWTPSADWTPAQHQAWEIRMRRGDMRNGHGRTEDPLAQQYDDFGWMIEAWNDEYGT